MTGKNFSANNSSGNRKPSDFYETPYSLTRLLLDNEQLSGTVLEPARGNGAIPKVLAQYGYSFTESDMENDFLTQTVKYDCIITNPPFSKALEFILKAKELANSKVVMLLPLSYLHGKKRYDILYSDAEFQLARVYVFTRYPMLGDVLREDGKHRTGMMVYAWYVWDKSHKGEPVIRWLDNNPFVISMKDIKTLV